MNGTCAIVETRTIANIRAVVENHKEFSGLPAYFFHGALNKDFVAKELDGLVDKFINLGVHELTSSGYNRLLTSAWFYNQLPCDTVLIFQHDSKMLRHGIEEFMKYDFIGAPILHMEGFMNGGISIRSVNAMKAICGSGIYNEQVDGNEDIYFVNWLRKSSLNLPTKEIAEKFSCETSAKMGTLCTHALEKYCTPFVCNLIYNQYKQR